MKVIVYSDLHNEFSIFLPPPNAADLVILAGDIDIHARGVKWASETFSCPVIYVAGNHEFYKGHIDGTLKKMRDAAAPHVFTSLKTRSSFGSKPAFSVRQLGLIFRAPAMSLHP